MPQVFERRLPLGPKYTTVLENPGSVKPSTASYDAVKQRGT